MASSGFSLTLPKVPSFSTPAPHIPSGGYAPPRASTKGFSTPPPKLPHYSMPTHRTIAKPPHVSLSGLQPPAPSKTELGISKSQQTASLKIPSSSPFKSISSQSAMTPEQWAKLQMAMHQQGGSGSLFDQLKHGGGSLLGGVTGAVGYALDKAERPLYAMTGAADAALNNHSILHGAEQGITGQKEMTFGQLMQKNHILDGHGTLRTLAGFGADMTLDPLNALTIVGSAALAPETGGASLALDAPLLAKEGIFGAADVAKVLEKAPELRQGFADAAKAAGVGTKDLHAMNPEELAKALKASTSQHLTDALHQAAMEKLPKLAQIRIRPVPFTSKYDLNIPTHLFGQRIMPMLPSLARTAEGRGLIAHLPLMGRAAKHVADHLGGVFKVGHKTTIFDTLALTHSSERLAHHFFSMAKREMRDAGAHKLSNNDMLDALHAFELKGGVKKVGDQFVVNDTHLAAHGLNPDQIKFVHAWHGIMERHRIIEKEMGLHYGSVAKGELERGYVPHRFMTDGSRFGAKARYRESFQHAALEDATLRNAIDLHRAGQLPHGMTPESDVMKILAHRLGDSAVANSKASYMNVLKHMVGVPSHVFDHAANARAEEAAQAARVNLAKATMAHRQLVARVAGEGARQTRLRAIERALGQHSAEIKQFQAGIADRVKRGFESHGQQQAAIMARKGKISSLRAERKMLLDESRRFTGVKQLASEKRLAGLQADVKKAEEKIGQTYKPNPDIPQGYIEATQAMESMAHHLKDTHIPEGVKDALSKVAIVEQHPEAIAGIMKQLEKAQAKWRIGVTSVNPGYGFKNTISDIWNMYLSGMPLSLVPVYFPRALKLWHDAVKGDAHAQSIIDEAQAHGVLSGLFGGDVNRRVTALRGSKNPFNAMLHANTVRENTGRLAHYLWRLDTTHDPLSAAREVRRAHFDYEALTDTERKIKNRWMPFYTWTRKNVPYQIQQYLSRPGRYAAFPAFGQEMEAGSGKHNGDLLPSWLGQGGAFAVGHGIYHMPAFGPADILRFANPMQGVAGLLGPQVQLPVEALTGTDPTTGIPLDTKDNRAPVNSTLAQILSLLPGTDVGKIARNETGHGYVHGMGTNPWVRALLDQLPITHLVASNNPINNTSNPEHLKMLNYLLGTTLYKPNQAQQAYDAQLNFDKSAQKQITRLEEAGVLPMPKPTKASANSQEIYNALLKRMRRR